MQSKSDSWLKICGAEDKAIENRIAQACADKISQGLYDENRVRYVEKLSFAYGSSAFDVKSFKVADAQLEKLRRLCQLWDVDIRVGGISSHRKFIGPFIVAFKKVLFPLIKVLLKDFIEQQREFNATCIALLSELSAQSAENKLSKQ